MNDTSLEITAGTVDGRTRRRDTNRNAVLDATIALFAEDLDATPEAVAARSGVSLRSVYRYFSDRDALVAAAVERQLSLIHPSEVIPELGLGPLESRIDRFVTTRVALFELVAPAARAARTRARNQPAVQRQVRAAQAAMLNQTAAHFRIELDQLGSRRDEVLGAIDALSQFETFDYLRRARELSLDDVAAVITASLTALLT